MCGRYRLKRADLLAAAFDALPSPQFEEFTDRGPRYGLRPTEHVPIVRLRDGRDRVLDVAGWGFIPSWARHKPTVRPFNARAETVATSSMFRQSFEQRRCLMPVDGFYEPKGKAKKRQAYFFRRPDDQPFALAGIWDTWARGDHPIETCTMLTTTPNAVLKPIHDRMPVVVLADDWQRWLDPNVGGGDVSSLLRPAPDDFLETWSVLDMNEDPESNGGYRSDIPEGDL